jgi:hypothetical protein
LSKKRSKVIRSSEVTPRLILPGYMASANAFMKRIRFVELINESIVWDQKQ